jgi:Metallo-peptidase family M12/Domain of Unknown Function (DUF1080)
MVIRKSLLKTLLALVVIATLAFGGLSAVQAQGVPPSMFGAAGIDKPFAARPGESFVSRGRFVSVNVNMLFDSGGKQLDMGSLPEITLNLFPDVNYTGAVTRAWQDQWGSYWSGQLKDVEGGYFYLTVADGVFMAHVASPLGVYEVSLADGTLYKAIQIDQSKFIDHDPAAKFDPPGQVIPEGSLGKTADTRDTIDIMVAYTDDARAAAGGTAAMKATILTALNETNTSYANAGITTRLRLVHVQEYAYVETGNLDTDLARFRGTSDPYFASIHSLRNTYGADMVGLIVEDGGAYCGLASAIMATPGNAFQVTDRGCATGYYSFGHEFGHLQGARHDTYVDPGTTPYAYGHGYVHTGSTASTRWRTVMAYNTRCSDLGYDCTRLQYWSNPTNTWLGAPMGNANAKNYIVLNNTAYTVANFRAHKIGDDFNSSFNGASTGWMAVSGSWAIGSGMYLQSNGLSGRYSSAKHTGMYGDLTYMVRMKRSGTCGSCQNYVSIRGTSSPLDSQKRWNKEYKFIYNNNGQFSVQRKNGTTVTTLKGWTNSAAIVKNDWNILKVIAVGKSLKFFINGTLVWSGTNSSFNVGQVGFGFQRGVAAGTLYVDWATLSTTPTADLNILDEVGP